MPNMTYSPEVTHEASSVTDSEKLNLKAIGRWVAVAALVYCMLLAVGMIGAGFKTATAGQAKSLFAFASNPFLGLIIGTVCTALIQSSSTVTSIIVGLVAGGLPVSLAIPMVMGANIGTTITNTIVSAGHMRCSTEFKRAFSAATVHDFFNLMAVAIFLPLEMFTGFLEKSSYAIASMLAGGSSMSMKGMNFIKPITKPIIGQLKGMLGVFSPEVQGVILALLGVGLIFCAITMMGKLLKKLMVGRAKNMLHAAIGRGPIAGITSGMIVTVLVQSSSTTTSLMIPLVGSGIFSMRQIYPFTLGSNIGTCITALLAATAVIGGNSMFALQIAFVHLLFNIAGVLVIFCLPFMREIPPRCAEWLADYAGRKKRYAACYVLGVFFLLPATFIMLAQ
ncbi:Na/Pi symporter [Halodesulfovibrio marinisediminis]|uniref:Solute carrier family 34 (Sodium-dependent phosphate cotransporter) n=1 Tax=Halodesulfovibrio marinisediminis DSM 17456 TaxID=1121457 RepID=A0A1N6F9F5_9BACT|nr:Na/Pi symporter [Halodesulfovibrio marinisediminis]SIN91880.1 solute carrier family 34 (sodium-dependent phosphate cotransporter) [Halodesulfovibrio marinisediminis DSM 17456]